MFWLPYTCIHNLIMVVSTTISPRMVEVVTRLVNSNRETQAQETPIGEGRT